MRIKGNKKYTKESHNCYSYFLNKTSKKAKSHCKKLLKKGELITFGIKPTKPETAYGYLRLSEINNLIPQKLSGFIEKPKKDLANKLFMNNKFKVSC